MTNNELTPVLERIADALERISPQAPTAPKLEDSDAFVWQAHTGTLSPVGVVNRVPFDLLKGIDQQAATLRDNSRQFALGYSANNALLWGARGTGKSSLVKAVHAALNIETPSCLMLVEIHREDIPTLPNLLDILKQCERRTILFCDDLSFDQDDSSYKSLKAVLDGGIEGRPDNVIFYATSNRRHLMPRDMIDNEKSTAINPSEAVEEKVSLSDRFGLWLGFHNLDQDTYFAIVKGYVDCYNLKISPKDMRAQALEWSMTRGARSGRVAWQFIQDLAGKQKKSLNLTRE